MLRELSIPNPCKYLERERYVKILETISHTVITDKRTIYEILPQFRRMNKPIEAIIPANYNTISNSVTVGETDIDGISC